MDEMGGKDTVSMSASDAKAGWQALLELHFEKQGTRTRLVHNRHEGPLRVLRALALPDGRSQAVIVHPPGGLVGGDVLDVRITLGAGAQVVCTTPGAQKWYRSTRAGAQAITRITLEADAALEWLPQPTLVHDSAQVDQALELVLAPGARMIGWECLVLGRAAMGERFLHGALRQRIALSIEGRPAWVERLVAEAGDRLFASPLGWGDRSVACTVWAVTAASGEADQAVTEAWRAVLARDQPPGDARLAAAVTCPVPGLVVARLLADDTEAVMRVAQRLWAQARPAVIGAPGDALRIWAT